MFFNERILVWIAQEDHRLAELYCFFLAILVGNRECFLRSPERFRCRKVIEIHVVENNVVRRIVPVIEIEHILEIHMRSE